MRATNTFQALCLGATLGLTGCVTAAYDDGGRGYGPPPRYGYDRGYGDDVQYVYDNRLDVYTVVGFPELWFSDGWYYRHSRGYWERCNQPRGGHWGRADWAYVPSRLRPRYGDYHGGGRDHGDWDRRDEHHERVDQRHDRKDERRDEHHERVDARREARDERTDWRHDRHDTKQAEHHERVDTRREARDDRADWRHDRRDAQQAERHERVDARHEQHVDRADARHDERAERKQARHDRKRDYAGADE